MMLDIVATQLPRVNRESIREGLEKIRDLDTIAGPLKYDPATREWNFRFIPGIIEKGSFNVAR